MKKLVTLASVLTLTAGAAFAGGMSEPVVEAEPIVIEDAPSSNMGLLIPALLVLAIAAAASDSSSSSTNP